MDTSIETTIQTYFNAVIFEALMEGIHFVVFLVALSRIWTGPKRQRQFKLGMTIVMTVLFVSTTADLAVYWAYVRHAIVTRDDSAGSIAAALNEYPPTWFVATNVFEAVNVLLADCISIWRAFIVWGRKWKVVIIPIAFTILTTGISIAELVEAVCRTGVDLTTAFWSLMLVTPIFCTTSVIYRFVEAEGTRCYAKIIELLVESAALYCFATILALITYLVPGLSFQYAFAFWKACTGIAPTLIVAGMATGKSGMNQRPWSFKTEEHLSSGNIPSTEIHVHAETRIYIDSGIGVDDHDFESKQIKSRTARS